MENRRLISLILAIVAMALVIIAGKSCTDDINKKNKEAKSKNETTAAQVTVRTPYDVVTAPAYVGDSTAPQNTQPVSRDIFGRPVTTEPVEILTDANGEPVTIPPETTEPQTNAEGETIVPEESSTATTMPKISGFNHGQDDEEEDTQATLPSDFALVIN